MLHGVKSRALGEHPAGEDALDVACEFDFIYLHEGGGVRRLCRGTRIADARRHLQRAELHRLIDRDFEMRDAPRNLVEGCEHGDRVLDDFRPRRFREGEADEATQQEERLEPNPLKQPLHAQSPLKAHRFARLGPLHSGTIWARL